MKAEDYHRLDALSASTIKTLLQKSAQHARMQQMQPDGEPSPQMERGTALHALTLGETDLIQVINAPDFRTKAAQQARDDARKDGRIPIIADKAAELYDIAATAREQIEDALKIDMGNDGQAETTLLWTEQGLDCKARPDWVSDFDLNHVIKIGKKILIPDLKFTEVSQQAWIKSIASNGYDIQSEWYRRAVLATHKIDSRFIFCVCEVFPPYPVYFVELTPAYRAIADVKIKRAIQLWTACVEANNFPCYSAEIMEIDPPAWEMAAAEEIDAETHGFSKEAFLFGRCAQK